MALAQAPSLDGSVYLPVFGVFLPLGDTLAAGESLAFSYIGKMSGRATDWTDRPFLAHFRYRSFGADGTAGAWTVLDDDQVAPLQITADATAKYVRVLMPMDVQAGVPFTIAIVATDHYGNPRTITGTVDLTGALVESVEFHDEWRKELTGVTVATPGFFKIVPTFAGARSIYHYASAWPTPPSALRLLGDVHSHSGDGGAQRKFIGAFEPGDHNGLFSRTHDALRYMHEVAGLDFGAVSEHSARFDGYAPPAEVAADPVFATGGACAGAGRAVPGLDNWWPRQQGIVADFDRGASGQFVAFPAYEWHGTHTKVGDRSPLHRVVLFHDFVADLVRAPLPMLPGDIVNVPPQCIIKFLADTGFTPDRALVGRT
jgi:hypothetical protein